MAHINDINDTSTPKFTSQHISERKINKITRSFTSKGSGFTMAICKQTSRTVVSNKDFMIVNESTKSKSRKFYPSLNYFDKNLLEIIDRCHQHIDKIDFHIPKDSYQKAILFLQSISNESRRVSLSIKSSEMKIHSTMKSHVTPVMSYTMPIDCSETVNGVEVLIVTNLLINALRVCRSSRNEVQVTYIAERKLLIFNNKNLKIILHST